jgi:DNA adenine methylase
MARYRTPLRYPGGKQRLAPFVAELLESNDALGWNYVEPYAGGAGVAMELLLDDKVGHVYLNDSSVHIYAFWKTILTDPDDFCRRISKASLSVDHWKRHREIVRRPDIHSLEDVGFSTFYLNRCNRSGVLTAGVIGGLAQEGKWRIDARFPRNELVKRIECIAEHRDQITVSNLDAEEFMISHVNLLSRQTIAYCDPPYYAHAERLYLSRYTRDDHIRLARVIQRKLRRPWLVSYDDHPDIVSLYRERRKFRYSLQYSAVRTYAGREVFVFSDDLRVPRTSVLPSIAGALRKLSRCA